jgi:TPR repeat protein
MYDEGIGVGEDNAAAVGWYLRAAGQGDAQVQNNLGAMYDSGEGIAEDNSEAVRWYLEAARQGNAIAQNNLGAMYYAGEGVELDKIEAYEWFFISGELGNANGGENRQIVGKSMHSGDVSKAGKLAAPGSGNSKNQSKPLNLHIRPQSIQL